jgi:hypothetical protein
VIKLRRANRSLYDEEAKLIVATVVNTDTQNDYCYTNGNNEGDSKEPNKSIG